ncbi:hypothetical protein IEE94_08950 [Yimella sp. cx-573]|nr:hypothetical protein [Yimella sp. cx-573]
MTSVVPAGGQGDSHAPFIASHLSTSLDEAVTVSLDEPRGYAHRRLCDAGFDQAPVRSGNDTIGWVPTRALEGEGGAVDDSMIPLSRTPIVASTTSLSHVLGLIGDGLIFTVHGAGLGGFIVPSDLDRHAMRGHFYVLIAEIEMVLSDVVGRDVDEKDIEELVRGTAGEGRYKKASRAGQDTRIVEYLDLKDLIDVFEKQVVTGDLPDVVSTTLAELPSFRNVVMHATKPLVVEYPPSRLADLDTRVRQVRDELSAWRRCTAGLKEMRHD